MAILPVIVGFGGMNSAGRSSFHHAYRRLLADTLDFEELKDTYTGLAVAMGLLRYEGQQYVNAEGDPVQLDTWLKDHRDHIDQHTLLRKMESNQFQPEEIYTQKSSKLNPDTDGPISFVLKKAHCPAQVPANWQVTELDDKNIHVQVNESFDALLPDTRRSFVQSAAQLPYGFDPGALYQSRSHPRGLQMAIYGASDAVLSMGIDWDKVMSHVAPDEVGVYSSSAMGQLDWDGSGGMLQANMRGGRVTSKQLALGLAEMPADFVNAYVLGSVGSTGGFIGACATFLYGLRLAVEDIRSGKRRIVVVGNSEAPVTPEVIEGYRTMGALAEDEALMALDGSSAVNHRRACRPFSANCGFTLAESTQYFVLCDDELALELGASIYGAVPDVFVNADGYKKSISGPGVGNYITFAKSAAVIESMLGSEGLKRSFAMAHGTGTPQNRVTESHIMNEVAKSFGLENWPVAAIKSYLGHSLASAGADQLVSTLGVWERGVIPGITSIDHIADDVHQSNLEFLMEHLEVGVDGMDAAILNSKGFGGNNASAPIVSPQIAKRILEAKHGQSAMTDYASRNDVVRNQAEEYDQLAIKGLSKPIYHFGQDVKSGEDVSITKESLSIEGYDNEISLDWPNPYKF